MKSNMSNIKKNLNVVKSKVAKTILDSMNQRNVIDEDLESEDSESIGLGQDEFVKFGVKNPRKRKNISFKPSSRKKKTKIVEL